MNFDFLDFLPYGEGHGDKFYGYLELRHGQKAKTQTITLKQFFKMKANGYESSIKVRNFFSPVFSENEG